MAWFRRPPASTKAMANAATSLPTVDSVPRSIHVIKVMAAPPMMAEAREVVLMPSSG